MFEVDEAMVRVLIVDDSKAMRDGISMCMDFFPEMEVVGMGENGLEAVEMTEELRPDAIVMDIQMPIMDGLEASRTIRNSNPNVYIVLMSAFPDHLEQWEQVGANTCFSKDCDPDDLVNALVEAVTTES